MDNTWGPAIELSADFYTMISKNVTGLRICLKTQSVGEKGVNIVCEKMYQHPEEIALCAYILHLNAHTQREWELIHSK